MPYRNVPPAMMPHLPHTDTLCDTIFALPTGAGVTTTDIALIGDILLSTFGAVAAVRSALSATPRLRTAA
jgi:dTDP-4-amino-4,6-dideoxygalactose transaminase